MNESFLVVNFTIPKNYIIPGIKKGKGRMEVSIESLRFVIRLK